MRPCAPVTIPRLFAFVDLAITRSIAALRGSMIRSLFGSARIAKAPSCWELGLGVTVPSSAERRRALRGTKECEIFLDRAGKSWHYGHTTRRRPTLTAKPPRVASAQGGPTVWNRRTLLRKAAGRETDPAISRRASATVLTRTATAPTILKAQRTRLQMGQSALSRLSVSFGRSRHGGNRLNSVA